MILTGKRTEQHSNEFKTSGLVVENQDTVNCQWWRYQRPQVFKESRINAKENVHKLDDISQLNDSTCG